MLEIIENPDGTTDWKSVVVGLVGFVVTVGVGAGVGYYLRGVVVGKKQIPRELYNRKLAIEGSLPALESSKAGLVRTLDLTGNVFKPLEERVPNYRNWTRFTVKYDGTRSAYTDTGIPEGDSVTMDKLVGLAWGDIPSSYYLHEAGPDATVADLPPGFTEDPKNAASFTPFSEQADASAIAANMARLDDDQKKGLFRLWHTAQIMAVLRRGIDDIDAQLNSRRSELRDLDQQIASSLRA
jgi:hypothetical protein